MAIPGVARIELSVLKNTHFHLRHAGARLINLVKSLLQFFALTYRICTFYSMPSVVRRRQPQYAALVQPRRLRR